MKIGIIGTGLSGYGAFLAIKNHKNHFDYTFFNFGDEIKNQVIEYKNLTLPKFPQKKEFNFSFSKVCIKNSSKSIRISNTRGGLSDFWSCSAFPFSNQEFSVRSIEYLASSYKELNKIINIAGRCNDPLDEIYQNHFTYGREISPARHLEALELLNMTNDQANLKFSVGNNRILIASTKDRNCTYCGNCFRGCPEDFLLRPEKEIKDIKINHTYIERIEKSGGYWHVFNKYNVLIDKYEVLFLGMGVYETIKLLIRSNLVNPKVLTLYDSNAIFFPIFFKKNFYDISYEKNFGYANKVIAIQEKESLHMSGHILITPFNHFFTYTLFGKLLGFILKGIFYKRFALATFYSESNLANSYSINYNGQCAIKADKSEECKSFLIKIINEVNLRHLPFKFLKLTKNFDSSSHYSSNLLDDKKPLLEASQFKENLFVIDGNLFPGPPPASPGSLNILTGAYTVMKEFIRNNQFTSEL